MKYLFVISDYFDYRQKIFDDIISPRNKEYCDYHGMKYIVIGKEHGLKPFRGSHTWNKWKVIQDLIKSGKLEDDDIIIQQDADVLWRDKESTYVPDEHKSMTICVDSGGTFCNGIFGLRINDWTKKLVDNILDEKIYNRMLSEYTIHEGFPNDPPSVFVNSFREQAVFYNLFGIKRHSWIPFDELPNCGVHSNKTVDTLYNIDDFNNHIQILPVEYNLTIWSGESDTTFYIKKFEDKSKVKFRHITGSDWNIVKNWL